MENCENSGFAFSKLVVGSGEQDINSYQMVKNVSGPDLPWSVIVSLFSVGISSPVVSSWSVLFCSLVFSESSVVVYIVKKSRESQMIKPPLNLSLWCRFFVKEDLNHV